MTAFALRHPYSVVASSLLVAALGLMAFLSLRTDLFPNTTPPQVLIITVAPGASAKNISEKITRIIENELNGVSGLKRVVSVSRDEVSSINAEFTYDKSIAEAVVDVQNAVGRIESELPADIKKPAIYKITNTTNPLLTIALTPKKESGKTLRDIRLLADNQIKNALLNVPGVADVDVFGANTPEIRISVSKIALNANNVSITDVIDVLLKHNIDFPSGYLYTNSKEYIVNTFDEFKNIREIENIPIKSGNGGTLFLRDVARVELTTAEPRSLYHGNGKPAIALNVTRLATKGTVAVIQKIKKFIPELRKRYPDIDFSLTTDQSPVINVNIKGMRSSLLQAIILTALVIFVFMADFRAAVVVSVSIPMAFCFSLVVLWFSPFTLNMVTLSGLIIAVGMVVDASIVVLENIFRHYRGMSEPDAAKATRAGTDEVKLSITAGMLTTVVVLVPVMFTGGYTQQIMRPLNLMICATLVASLVAALTIVPLLTAKLLAGPKRSMNPLERLLSRCDAAVERLSDFYTWLLGNALRHRFAAVALALALFAVSMRVVPPLIGKEMMPPMDTGISIISFTTQSDLKLSEIERIVERVEGVVKSNRNVRQISTVVGSEPGQISFGGGGKTLQNVTITTRMTPRNERKETIWEVDAKWRAEIAKIPGIVDLMVAEYGATPVSTTKAPLDIIISGPESKILDKLADEVVDRLKSVPGLLDVRRSWRVDKPTYRLRPDHLRCATYGITPKRLAQEVKATLKGYKIGAFNLEDYLAIPIRLRYEKADIDTPDKLGDIYLPTKEGFKQLRTVASVERVKTQPYITRENLTNTIDVTALNSVLTIGQAAALAEKRLADMRLPAGYELKVAGSMADMKASNKRMMKALLIGLVLLYLLLLAMFKSFAHPFTIMAAIPLAVAGAMWGLLVFDKPMCKPAMMGIIFLGGTIVNNSILLLDFIINARKDGMSKNDAITHAVKLRLRPILMTTTSTIVGLLPLIFEMAVGLERMSPLGIVAGTGLLVGTFLTMVVIPVVYSIVDSFTSCVARLFNRQTPTAS